jgi:hypothetical protein
MLRERRGRSDPHDHRFAKSRTPAPGATPVVGRRNKSGGSLVTAAAFNRPTGRGHFFDAGDAGEHLVDRGLLEGLHAFAAGQLADFRVRALVQNRVARVGIDAHDLKHTGPAGVSGVEVGRGRYAPREVDALTLLGTQAEDLGRRSVRVIGLALLRAHLAQQPLCNDAVEAVGDEHRREFELAKQVDGGGGVAGVQRAQHLRAGQRRAGCDVRRFRVANLADHDDVRILAEHAAQRFDKTEADLGVGLNLVDVLDPPLDRVFDRDHAAAGIAQEHQAGVGGGAFATADRSDAEQHAARRLDGLLQNLELCRLESQLAEFRKLGVVRHEPEDQPLAVDRRPAADADVPLVLENGAADVPVLAQTAFGDVHAGHAGREMTCGAVCEVSVRTSCRMPSTRRRTCSPSGRGSKCTSVAPI